MSIVLPTVIDKKEEEVEEQEEEDKWICEHEKVTKIERKQDMCKKCKVEKEKRDREPKGPNKKGILRKPSNWSRITLAAEIKQNKKFRLRFPELMKVKGRQMTQLDDEDEENEQKK